MSPTPIVPSGKHPYHPDCVCKQCFETYQDRIRARNALRYGAEDPLNPARGIIFGLILSLTCIALALIGAAVIWTHVAQARTTQPAPIQRPVGLALAKKQCPDDATLVECRAALRRALAAKAWQRHARWSASAGTSKDVVLEAIAWASAKTGVEAWRLANIARCESHLFFLAHNGQYLGVWQLGAMHRSDPIFDVVPWMDPFAQAIHVARFIKAHGSGAWQCSEYGGLRW